MLKAKKYLSRFIKRILSSWGYYITHNSKMHGAPEHFGAIMFSRKLAQFDYFYEKILELEGDVVESGIWWGYGILAHLRYVGLGRYRRKIIGFDSFRGHSKPRDRDLVGGKFANPGSQFSITEDDAWRTLEMGTDKTVGELKKTVTIIGGWLEETMPIFKDQNQDQKIALVHCDPDLYEPILVTLTNVWDKLVIGGIVIVGKLNNPEYMGKTEAVRDFLKDLPESSYRLESVPIHEIETYKKINLSYIVKTGT